jgi:hypothetical protein
MNINKEWPLMNVRDSKVYEFLNKIRVLNNSYFNDKEVYIYKNDKNGYKIKKGLEFEKIKFNGFIDELIRDNEFIDNNCVILISDIDYKDIQNNVTYNKCEYIILNCNVPAINTSTKIRLNDNCFNEIRNKISLQKDEVVPVYNEKDEFVEFFKVDVGKWGLNGVAEFLLTEKNIKLPPKYKNIHSIILDEYNELSSKVLKIFKQFDCLKIGYSCEVSKKYYEVNEVRFNTSSED